MNEAAKKHCILQAHRGVATEYPENTMVAFRAAVEQGYEYIELDPNYTKDGKLVVLHDAALNRCARNKDGSELSERVEMANLTYEEALEYDFGIAFSEKFRGEKVPLLEDVFEFAKANNVKLKLDNKLCFFPGRIQDALYDLIRKYEPWAGISTQSTYHIKFLHREFPNADLHYDGYVDEAILERMADAKDHLRVWVPHLCQYTSGVTFADFADEALCDMVRRYASLGIWLIRNQEDYAYVSEHFHPDAVETDGAIKPQREN